VVQIWLGLIVCKQVTVCPGHIWTTLYYKCSVYKPSVFTRNFSCEDIWMTCTEANFINKFSTDRVRLWFRGSEIPKRKEYRNFSKVFLFQNVFHTYGRKQYSGSSVWNLRGTSLGIADPRVPRPVIYATVFKTYDKAQTVPSSKQMSYSDKKVMTLTFHKTWPRVSKGPESQNTLMDRQF
jgi:hypothetical protein